MIVRTLVGVCTILILISATLGNWATYKDEKRGYQIKYPAKWEAKDMYNAAFFMSPKEGTTDLFQENINIMVQDLSVSPEPVTLEGYTELSKQQIKSLYGDSALEYVKERRLAGHDAGEMVYFMPITTSAGTPMRLKLWQVWFIEGKNAYLFTFTSDEKEFDKHIGTVKEAAESIKLL